VAYFQSPLYSRAVPTCPPFFNVQNNFKSIFFFLESGYGVDNDNNFN
jgi:hypothetical protein